MLPMRFVLLLCEKNPSISLGNTVCSCLFIVLETNEDFQDVESGGFVLPLPV